MIAVHKQLVFLKEGIGIHRKQPGIAQGYAFLFTGQPGKELPQIRDGCHSSGESDQGKGGSGKKTPSFHQLRIKD
jgi:hypothetical protein